MEYFRILPDKRTFSLIKPLEVDLDRFDHRMARAEFENIPAMFAAFCEEIDEAVYCDFIYNPTFMMNMVFKELFEVIEPNFLAKPVQVLPKELKKDDDLKLPLYWLPHLEPLECMHSDAEVYTVGLVRKLVLSRNKIAARHIVKVQHNVENIWVVSLAAAECILRRSPLGIKLERVEVRD